MISSLSQSHSSSRYLLSQVMTSPPSTWSPTTRRPWSHSCQSPFSHPPYPIDHSFLFTLIPKYFDVSLSYKKLKIFQHCVSYWRYKHKTRCVFFPHFYLQRNSFFMFSHDLRKERIQQFPSIREQFYRVRREKSEGIIKNNWLAELQADRWVVRGTKFSYRGTVILLMASLVWCAVHTQKISGSVLMAVREVRHSCLSTCLPAASTLLLVAEFLP